MEYKTLHALKAVSRLHTHTHKSMDTKSNTPSETHSIHNFVTLITDTKNQLWRLPEAIWTTDWCLERQYRDAEDFDASLQDSVSGNPSYFCILKYIVFCMGA